MIKKETKQEILKKINRFINSIWFVIILGIIVLAKTLFFYYNTISLTEILPLETLVGTTAFITVCVCFLLVLPNRARAIFALIANLLFSILLFADNAYYAYSNNVLSIAQITNLQYGEEIVNTLPLIINAKYILYFLDLIILAIAFGTKMIKLEKKQKSTNKQISLRGISLVIGISIFIVICNKYIEQSSDKPYNKDMQIRESTIFGYHVYDIESAINIKNRAKYSKYENMIKEYENLKIKYDQEYGKEKYELQGIAQDKNIIIVQLESIQEFLVHKKINGKEIMPNLNRFLEENIEFTNMHIQSYSTTADSEHSVITSIYPMENGMSFSRYFTNTYDDIYKLYNEANYYTSYMHGNDAYFWNRGKVYEQLNVKDVALKDKFDDTEYICGFMSDEAVYTQAVPKLKEFETPFFSFIVAASSHTPFDLDGLQDRSKIDIDVRKI